MTPVTPPEPRIALAVENLSFSFGKHRVIESADFSIESGDFVCVIGPNGGGKTTLLKLVLGLLTPGSGRIEVLGLSPRAASPRVGYVPQNARLDPLFPITVLEVVLMGRLGRGSLFGPYSRKDREAATKALEDVGLGDLGARPYSALSGGQQQRVLIARALASGPDLLMLDEPTANLDRRVETEFTGLLREINRRMTVVMVSHDLGFVAPVARKALCVNRRIHMHPTAHITGDVIRDLYGGDVHVVQHHRDYSPEFEREGKDGCPHS